MKLEDYIKFAKDNIKQTMMNHYWKTSNVEVDRRAPLFKGNCMIVHAPGGAGKTHLLTSLLRDIPKTVKIIVITIDERSREALEWSKVADKVINLSKSTRLEEGINNLTSGVRKMWDEFVIWYITCLKLALECHEDVLLVIDSCNKLATIANQAKVTETGNTIPGGVDQNSIDLVGAFLEVSGCYEGGGSLTIWGTCFLQNESEALCKGASAVLNGVSMSDIVLNRNHTFSDLTHSRSAHLLNDVIESKSERLLSRKYTYDYRNLYRA